MSMPSSSELVATTQRRVPDFRASSISARCSLDTEPWWARANSSSVPWAAWPLDCPAPPISSAGEWRGACARGVTGWSAVPGGWEPPSGWEGAPPSGSWPPGSCRSSQISLRRPVSRSARRRELAKTMVDRFAATRSTIRSSTCGQIEALACSPDPGPRSWAAGVEGSSVMSGTGTVTWTSQDLVEVGATTRTGWMPPRNRATSSFGSTVAESPMRWAGVCSSASSRSRETARCAPRLVPATACTSSTITVSTPASVARACEVSMR